MVKYVIEVWNPVRKKYVRFWEGNSAKLANIMFNKSYYSKKTRRLLQIETVVIIKVKETK